MILLAERLDVGMKIWQNPYILKHKLGLSTSHAFKSQGYFRSGANIGVGEQYKLLKSKAQTGFKWVSGGLL